MSRSDLRRHRRRGLAVSSLASVSTNRGSLAGQPDSNQRFFVSPIGLIYLFALDLNAPLRFGPSRGSALKRSVARTTPRPRGSDRWTPLSSHLGFLKREKEKKKKKSGKPVENSDGYRLRPARFRRIFQRSVKTRGLVVTASATRAQISPPKTAEKQLRGGETAKQIGHSWRPRGDRSV